MARATTKRTMVGITDHITTAAGQTRAITAAEMVPVMAPNTLAMVTIVALARDPMTTMARMVDMMAEALNIKSGEMAT